MRGPFFMLVYISYEDVYSELIPHTVPWVSAFRHECNCREISDVCYTRIGHVAGLHIDGADFGSSALYS